MRELEQCTLCPFKCKVNRKNNELGRCRAGRDKDRFIFTSL